MQHSSGTGADHMRTQRAESPAAHVSRDGSETLRGNGEPPDGNRDGLPYRRARIEPETATSADVNGQAGHLGGDVLAGRRVVDADAGGLGRLTDQSTDDGRVGITTTFGDRSRSPVQPRRHFNGRCNSLRYIAHAQSVALSYGQRVDPRRPIAAISPTDAQQNGGPPISPIPDRPSNHSTLPITGSPRVHPQAARLPD